MLHMVVGQIADDVPAYVIENERGKQKVLHLIRLLLWSSAEEEEGLQMTATQLTIPISMLVLEPLPIGKERSRVPYAWSINGYWPVFSQCLMLQNQKQGHLPLWSPQRSCLKKELANRGRMVRTLHLNWNTPSRAQPYPSRKVEN